CAIAAGGAACAPPSEKESGVTFRTPITRVPSSTGTSGRPAGRRGRCAELVTGTLMTGGSPPVDECHGLAAGARVLPQHPQHRAGGGAGDGGADAANRHARVR